MPECKDLIAATELDIEAEFKDFAYIVSHDLAGPIRSMVSFSQLLTERVGAVPDEDDRLHMELIIENGQKLGNMVQGLLAYSRLNTVARKPEKVDLEVILARCHMEHQAKLDILQGELDYPAMPAVMADPSRMFTLFDALIDNAIKFRRDNTAPVIRILVTEAADHWQFAVEDNGIGIDPMFHDDVFRPLRKLHTDEAYPGIGMGLTLARKIVLQHGGKIWIERSASGGASVRFTLAK